MPGGIEHRGHRGEKHRGFLCVLRVLCALCVNFPVPFRVLRVFASSASIRFDPLGVQCLFCGVFPQRVREGIDDAIQTPVAVAVLR